MEHEKALRAKHTQRTMRRCTADVGWVWRQPARLRACGVAAWLGAFQSQAVWRMGKHCAPNTPNLRPDWLFLPHDDLNILVSRLGRWGADLHTLKAARLQQFQATLLDEKAVNGIAGSQLEPLANSLLFDFYMA